VGEVLCGGGVLPTSVGVFGVVAGDAASQWKEIGIRLALGSSDSGILLLLLARAARAVVAGLAVGVAIALLAGRGVQSLLFGIGVADPVSVAIVSVLVGALALAATVIPGLRALGRSPIAALREG
jgi:putative ABC transport system permease protein